MFKQVGNSEKPDIIAAKILEGRIAIIVNNSPIVLTLPFIFLEDLQNSNDYYSLSYYSSYIRIIRLLGIFIAVVVPGLYISLRLYHYNVMPINFLMTIGNSSETIPFTPFVEIMFILILFEILYEVSLRLHRYFGLATSIVGALILGDTGVKAGLISSPGVMMIALSVIAV
jgi:spore germination protein KA